MKSLTSSDLDQLNFDNSDVTEMAVRSDDKTFVIRCVGADLTQGDDDLRLENVSIVVSGYESIQARLFIDDEFQTVEATDAKFFLAEVCELTHKDNKTMISGFSTQEGSWADYTVIGGTFEVSAQA